MDLIIIDGNSLANRAFYGVPPLSNSKGITTNAVYGFLNMINKLIEDHQPAYFAVAFDERGKVFRHEKFEAYKLNRKGMPEDLRSQMDLIREAMTLLNIHTIGMEGYEGDDIIGTVTKWFAQQGMTSVIVSGDRDTFQLVDDHISVFYPKKGLSNIDIVTPVFLEEKYKLRAKQIIDLKGLMGDSSDNIPGVPGIGEKTAQKLLADYDNMENLYAHLEDFSGKKLGEKLKNHQEEAFLSKELATIDCQVPLELHLEEFKCEDPQVEKLKTFYEKLELRHLLEQLNHRYSDKEIKENNTYDELNGVILSDIDEMNAFCKQLKHEPICMVAHLTKEHTVSFLDIAQSGTIARFEIDENGYHVYELFKAFLQNNVDIYTDDAKKLCHAFYLMGTKHEKNPINDRNIVFDALICDYLLDSERREHTLDMMIENYLHFVVSGDELQKNWQRVNALESLKPIIQNELEDKKIYNLYYNVERPLACILAKMEFEGIAINVNHMKALRDEFNKRLDLLAQEITLSAGEDFNINSPKQLARVLFESLKLPVIKKTKTGYSTNAEVLEALIDEHPIIRHILEFRQISKLKSTYIDGLMGIADQDDTVHTSFNQTLTATGRLSSSEPNLQNIPIRTEEGCRIRQAFIPKKAEWILVAADYSQIELRILAHMSQDEKLMQSFLKQEDIHRRTASEVFHIPLDEVTSQQRRAAKAVNFGIIYGQTDYGLSRELKITRKEAQDYINRYFERYQTVRIWLDRTVEAAREYGEVKTLFGRTRKIPDINSKNFNLRSFAERTAVNTPIQGTAADIIKLAMIACEQRLSEAGFQARMLLQVHDELVFEAPPEEVGVLIQYIHSAMEEVVELNVPLKVDVKIGFNWQEMEKV